MFSAIQYYRRAVQLVPDIELKIDDFSKPTRRGLLDPFEYLFNNILA